MNFCSRCAAPVVLRIPPGDERLRHVCDTCGTIHYRNPKIVVGCIAEWEGRILLCRRAIEPRAGLWTLPAGFMENGESSEAGAARETWEEACARVEIDALFAYLSIPRINQVYVMFRGRIVDGVFSPGQESLETKLFSPDDIPWQEIAFPSITRTLELWLRDRSKGKGFGIHCDVIERDRPIRSDDPQRPSPTSG
ncbi:NUDIX hydrolase [Thioalkalivibrio sp. HK1]|uniref:NUDIX hydrolase n=1 Tax=Thioalkalivibrio sp. HK1 TaxID=1469245 RepID=UPI000470E1EA|nr:NUDIX hydrolase [Thioalkalivibrio sp. HK1]